MPEKAEWFHSIIRNKDNAILDIQLKIERLRFRAKGNQKRNEQLDKVLWYSVDMLYPQCERTATQKAIDNRKCKKRRVAGRIKGMAQRNRYIYFLTFTFSNESLSRLGPNTRRRYVKTWLGENCSEYVANVDYGKENGREHYHAVVALERILDLKTTWPYGAFNIQRVDCGMRDKARLAKYLLKLSKHAGKLGTGSIIYSKAREREQSGATDEWQVIDLTNRQCIDELPF